MVPGDHGDPSPPAQRPVVEDASRLTGPASIQILSARDLPAQERATIHRAVIRNAVSSPPPGLAMLCKHQFLFRSNRRRMEDLGRLEPVQPVLWRGTAV